MNDTATLIDIETELQRIGQLVRLTRRALDHDEDIRRLVVELHTRAGVVLHEVATA